MECGIDRLIIFVKQRVVTALQEFSRSIVCYNEVESSFFERIQLRFLNRWLMKGCGEME